MTDMRQQTSLQGPLSLHVLCLHTQMEIVASYSTSWYFSFLNLLRNSFLVGWASTYVHTQQAASLLSLFASFGFLGSLAFISVSMRWQVTVVVGAAGCLKPGSPFHILCEEVPFRSLTHLTESFIFFCCSVVFLMYFGYWLLMVLSHSLGCSLSPVECFLCCVQYF